jgi:hypothetical protein
MNEAARLEYTYGCGLDNLEVMLSWNPNTLDDTRFRAWKEATLAVVHIAARHGLQSARAASDERLIEVRRRLAQRSDDGMVVGTADTTARKR